MNPKLKERLEQAFQLTFDLIEHLEETALTLDLPHLPSNQIAGQLWCVVGARESYTLAIQTGEWQGFSCSLTTPRLKQAVLHTLATTQQHIHQMDFSHLTENQLELAFHLLEHEIQHHGQLIRFVYGNKLTFPESWHKRYSV